MMPSITPRPLAAFSLQRVSIATVVFAIFVVLIVAGGAYWWFRRKRTKQTIHERGDAEQLHQQTTDDRQTVPLRSQAWGVPTEAKWAAFLAGVVILYITLQVYTYLKTGSPGQSMYSAQAKGAVLVIVGMAGGWLTKRWADGKYGRIEAIVESIPDEEDVEASTEKMTYWFHVDDTVQTEQGLAVNRYSESRFLFLFRLPMRHADVPLLRNDDGVQAPPDEQVTIDVPERAHELKPNVYTFRTKGRKPSKDTTSPIDIQWQPAFSMSYEEKKEREQDRKKLLTDIRETNATNARLTQRVMQLEQALSSALEENWEQFMEVAEEFNDLLDGSGSSRGDQVTVPREVVQQMAGGRSSRPDGAYADVGDQTHAEAVTDGRGGPR